MSGDLDLRRRRALYRAEHRGTKEMDWMIGRYAVAHLPTMDAETLTAFERFLQLSDVALNGWIMKAVATDDRETAGFVAAIRAFHKLDQKAL